MFVLALSPMFALMADLIRKNLSIRRRWIFILIIIFTLPSFVIWSTGYDYALRWLKWSAWLVVIASILLMFYMLLEVELKLKMLITVFATTSLVLILFFSSAFSSFVGGSRKILHESQYESFTARELGPKLHGTDNSLVVKKSGFHGLVEKTIFETGYQIPVKPENCLYYIKDPKADLVYDLCRRVLLREN